MGFLSSHKLFVFGLVCFLVTSVSNVVRAGENPGSNTASIVSFDIRTNKKVALFNPHKASMFSFFEPDCSWCFKQIKALEKIQKNCEIDLHIVLVGTNGNKQQLHRFVQKTNNIFPAVQHPTELQKLTGKIKATPTNVFFDHKQKLLAKKSGLIKIERLTNIVAPGCNY